MKCKKCKQELNNRKARSFVDKHFLCEERDRYGKNSKYLKNKEMVKRGIHKTKLQRISNTNNRKKV